MEKKIDWAAPQIEWMSFGADEYVAACTNTKTISASDCVMKSVASSYYVYHDVQGDGLQVKDFINAIEHNDDSGSTHCSDYTINKNTTGVFSWGISLALKNVISSWINDSTNLTGDEYISHSNGNGGWSWIEDGNIARWAGIYYTGYTYSDTERTPMTAELISARNMS